MYFFNMSSSSENQTNAILQTTMSFEVNIIRREYNKGLSESTHRNVVSYKFNKKLLIILIR